MKALLTWVTICASLVLCPFIQAESATLGWQTQYSEAISLAQSTRKPVVILFTGTNWCPACAIFEREVISQPAFTDSVRNHFIFLKAEFPGYSDEAILASPYKPLLDRYHVELFPTLVVINANGQKIESITYQGGTPSLYVEKLLNLTHAQ